MKKLVLKEYKVLFLDDGGVLNDNERRASQWRQLIGQYFSPRYGGTIEEWKNANKKVFDEVWERYLKASKEKPLIDYKDFWKREQIRWLTEMFMFVQVAPPPYNQRARIAREASEWVTSRVRSFYPGVIKTIKFLSEKGIIMCMASGEVSWELRGYLKGMGVLDYFYKLYGPDIINRMKASKSFYQKILDDMQILPTDAIVIDDSADFLSMASEIGITTIHVNDHNPCIKKTCNFHIKTLNNIKMILEP